MEFKPAKHYEPNGPETSTHKGVETGKYYREPGSGSAVKWLVWCEGESMRGWRGTLSEGRGELGEPVERLIRLQ